MMFRAATMEDAETLFRWRNDPVTRANSISQDLVPWDNHVAWLSASLKRPDRKILIAGFIPVGTVRFDTVGDITEMSWTVAPEARGKGVGFQMVLAASEGKSLVAKILKHNLASQKIAAKAGFSMLKDADLQDWEKLGAQI